MVLLTSPISRQQPPTSTRYCCPSIVSRHFVEHFVGTFCLTSANDWFWSLFTDPNPGFSFKTVIGPYIALYCFALLGPLSFHFPPKRHVSSCTNLKSWTTALLQWTEKWRRWKWNRNIPLTKFSRSSFNSDSWIPFAPCLRSLLVCLLKTFFQFYFFICLLNLMFILNKLGKYYLGSSLKLELYEFLTQKKKL